MNKEVLQFQKECFANYLSDVRKLVPEIPNPYSYPDGNPIRPVVPVKTEQQGIMLIGAFPSARFERRSKVLIPIGDNLSPFGQEEYFDGREVRTQASRSSLDENYFSQLNIDSNKIWMTDIVKVYLYPEAHIHNCKIIYPRKSFVNTHRLFAEIAAASMNWMQREIAICNPRLIITLGDVAARAILDDKKSKVEMLLNGEVRSLTLDKEYKIVHLAHPEIRRRNKTWNDRTEKAIVKLAQSIASYGFK
jgi:hypothetical protein